MLVVLFLKKGCLKSNFYLNLFGHLVARFFI